MGGREIFWTSINHQGKIYHDCEDWYLVSLDEESLSAVGSRILACHDVLLVEIATALKQRHAGIRIDANQSGRLESRYKGYEGLSDALHLSPPALLQFWHGGLEHSLIAPLLQPGSLVALSSLTLIDASYTVCCFLGESY